ncbi:MAG: rhodanese-like domain-containing protein [Leptolyngbyaceae bacterium]|nr:rhodanese-like domain-containing protein [Leptolyngbyaceae bacterium]
MADSPSFQSIASMSVHEFAERQRITVAPLQLIDVRELEEIELAKLDGFLHLPLSQFGEWSIHIADSLNPDTETVVMCHHGIRSAQMCAWLMQQGFSNVKNLSGGIDAYSVSIDPQVPRY